MNKKELYELTGLTNEEVDACNKALKSLKDDNLMTEMEKELYKKLQVAEGFIVGYNAWDDYMQYLMKRKESYGDDGEPTTADEHNIIDAEYEKVFTN